MGEEPTEADNAAVMSRRQFGVLGASAAWMAAAPMNSVYRSPSAALTGAVMGRNDPTGTVSEIAVAGRGTYLKSTVAPTTDEATYGWAFTDAGGAIWRKPITRRVNAAEWGVTAHTAFDAANGAIGTPDDQAPILNALLAHMAANANGGVLSFEGLRGAVYLASSVYVPQNVGLDGTATSLGLSNGLRFRPRADGVFRASDGTTVSLAANGHCRDGILFWLNIAWSSPNNWVLAYPGLCGTISNMHIDGLPTRGIKGFRFAGTFHFRSIKHICVSTLIEKPFLYSDATVIEDVDGGYRADDPAYYLINLPGLGDGVRIATVASGYTLTKNLVSRGLFLGCCSGGKVSGLINGIHTFFTSRAVTVDTMHLEDGQIIVDSADVSISNGFVTNGNLGIPPIIIKNSVANGNLNHRRVSVTDMNFVHPMNRLGRTTGWAKVPVMDIDLQSPNMTLVMNGGNRRTIFISGQIEWTQAHAPLIGSSTDAAHAFTDRNFLFADWTNYAHMLARTPSTISHCKVEVSGIMPGRAAPWHGVLAQSFTPGAGVPGVTYKGPSVVSGNTYHVRQLADPVRLIGLAAVSGETAQSGPLLSGQSTLPGFKLNAQSVAARGWAMLEVYRDTGSKGAFDKRVLIPSDDSDWFVDDGNALNGFAWDDYGPGAVLPINATGMAARAQYVDGLVRLLDSTVGPPTVGTWQAGDLIELPSAVPDASGLKKDSTRCRQSGAPGTWDDRYSSSLAPRGR